MTTPKNPVEEMELPDDIPVLMYKFESAGPIKTGKDTHYGVLMLTPWTQDTLVLNLENCQELKALMTEAISVLKRAAKKLEVVESELVTP